MCNVMNVSQLAQVQLQVCLDTNQVNVCTDSLHLSGCSQSHVELGGESLRGQPLAVWGKRQKQLPKPSVWGNSVSLSADDATLLQIRRFLSLQPLCLLLQPLHCFFTSSPSFMVALRERTGTDGRVGVGGSSSEVVVEMLVMKHQTLNMRPDRGRTAGDTRQVWCWAEYLIGELMADDR